MSESLRYYIHDKPLQLESGDSLPRFQLAYSTYGKLSDDGSNAVWIVHALTADSKAADWWPGVIGPGLAIDTDRYFVICANTLGSHYGSTSPLTTDPLTNKKYYHNFPVFTNRDIINSFTKLIKHLGIKQLHSVIGASLGGQQALEWSVMYPSHMQNLLLIATNAQHSPYGIAFNESQRMAIEADSSWHSDSDNAGIAGLRAARAMALISYRTRSGYNHTQKRSTKDLLTTYRAASYQRYQGEKLAKRFNAYSYYRLSQAMDSHDVSRGRGNITQALARVTATTTVVGIDSDILFPIEEQELLARHISDAKLHVIESQYGHDGFLIEPDQMSAILRQFLCN